MIESKTGDVLAQDVDALVNTVNCEGFMGRGIALQFRKAWPDNFKAYAAACRKGEVQPGRMLIFATDRLTGPRFIINFPTKRHWRAKSKIEDIESGLVALVQEIKAHGIRSIAVPPLGAGLGGLDWRDVKPRIEAALGGLPDLHVVLLEPAGPPKTPAPVATREIPMTAGRAALVALMDRYLRGLLDPFVSLLEVHKLMYFMQVAGEPLRLDFVKHRYGPYANNLRHVLNQIEGVFVSGYGTDGDAPGKSLEILAGAVDKASAFLSDVNETRARLGRVEKLVDGFESSFGLELLSTVHWVATHEGARSIEAIVDRTHDWSDRKRQFTPEQIKIAHDRLLSDGWINAKG